MPFLRIDVYACFGRTHGADVSVKVALLSKCCLTVIAGVWPDAFVHTALVFVKVAVLPNLRQTNVTGM